MKIQLKRSSVLENNAAKVPSVGQMDYGEIAVNYNDEDPVLFIKDSNNNIIRLAGRGSEGSFTGDYNDLTNKPTIGDGTLTVKDGNGVTVDTFTANQVGDTTITLPSGDYNDLINKPTIGDATITLKLNGTTQGSFTTNQVDNADINLDIDSSEVIISNSAPNIAEYSSGTLWWNSDDGNLYVLYQDNNSTQWVQSTATVGGGAKTLQEVTDQGNVTTNDITVNNLIAQDIQAVGFRIDLLTRIEDL